MPIFTVINSVHFVCVLQMDTLVNPLRNSMRNVSNVVKSIPDSLAEGMTKVSDNVGKMSDKLGHEIKTTFLKVL